MPYLGFIDTAGIQSFIFRSPKMPQITAASDYIEQLTGQSGLFRAALSGNAALRISAGGNAVYTAEDAEDLRRTFRTISRKLLEQAGGLDVRAAIAKYSDGSLAAAYRRATLELERKKLTQPRSLEFGFPGLHMPPPALGSIATTQPDANGYIYPRELDDMILAGYWKHGPEKAGLMAVVSMDGLSMGRRLIRWLESMEASGVEDEEFLSRFSAWSGYVKSRWMHAWNECVTELDEKFVGNHRWEHPHPAQAGRYLALNRPTEPRYLRERAYVRPIRKIYQGGDDLVFVCDARIALAFTTSLMRHLHAEPGGAEPVSLDPTDANGVEPEFRRVNVSAGLVFVDSHFPFSRAVRLADDTRKSAKAEAVSRDERDPPPVLDWWVNRQGALERPAPSLGRHAIEHQRPRTVRPVGLRARPGEIGDVGWEELEQQVLCGMWTRFMGLPAQGTADSEQQQQRDGRNKLKDLLMAAEEGRNAVERLLRTRPLTKGDLSSLAPKGWELGFDPGETRTVLLDAGELFDLHFPYTIDPQAPEGP